MPAPGHGEVTSCIILLQTIYWCVLTVQVVTKQPGEERSEEVVLGWEMVLIISLGSLLIILSTIGDTSHVTRHT